MVLTFFFQNKKACAIEFSNQTFLIAGGNSINIYNSQLWEFLRSDTNSGVELNVSEINKRIFLSGTNQEFIPFLHKIEELTETNETKVIPLFIHFKGKISVLDSIIQESSTASKIFFLPQGETWPTLEYLIQSNRRIILFIDGNFENESRILHRIDNYVLSISASETTETIENQRTISEVNRELFLIKDFDKLPTTSTRTINGNLIPDFINYLLENWTKFGKRPNFIFTGSNYSNFDFIVSQLNSFTFINGTVKVSGKTLEKVYWRNPNVSTTGGKFSFPFRGGEELMLMPFAPGFKMSPEQIVITGEMEVHENYSVIATPIQLGQNLTGNFTFENIIMNSVDPTSTFNGENYSFSQDIERGNVIKLTENASVNLGDPEQFGLRNNSFTVSCFVKFTEILEFGDNAILGNYEREYRRGLHLILRSGHPYFGLWANDYVSEEKLLPNIWYHLVWRYIIETGEQAIFLNGKNIGSSQGHPPFSGTGDILLGSALSEGASLRGYIDDLYFWNRPLGNEEINRLALNEEIQPFQKEKESTFFVRNKTRIIILSGFIFLVLLLVFFRFRKTHKRANPINNLPQKDEANQISLFKEFNAINNQGENITKLFTPKVKELFLFVFVYSLRNGNGALISEINEHLWPGIEAKKIANNRAVTLNKLRKILNQIDGIEILIENRNFVVKMEAPFFSDYSEAFKLCQIPGGMSKQQLQRFFYLVKKGSFLKGITWEWLDEIRGFTGNQVIDNLINLASIYKKENKLEEIDAISKRILDYDDLNEEALFFQIWVLQKTNNSHLAKFNFKSFCQKYEESMGEKFQQTFDEFIEYYAKNL